MDWRPVQGVLCLSPNDSWDTLQPSCVLDKARIKKGWMDGLMQLDVVPC